jgi:hypothetical protein
MRTFTDAAKKLVLTTAFAALTVFSVSLGNCQAGGSFSVLSYNVDGLPQILQDGRFPGGNPALYTPYIGAKVIPYDIVNVQEDFNSHAALYAADTHPYRTATSGGAGTGSGLNTMSNFPFSDDIDRVTWKVSSSDNGNNLTPKGYLASHPDCPRCLHRLLQPSYRRWNRNCR